MAFEIAMRFHFGEKADMIASLANDPAKRKNWLRKFARHIRKEILSLDTDAKHKERLLDDIDAFEHELKIEQGDGWRYVFHLIQVIGLLLGIFDVSGSKRRRVFYVRDPESYYADLTADIGAIGKVRDKDNIIRIRRETVDLLRNQGVEFERIALVMNTSVSALKREINRV